MTALLTPDEVAARLNIHRGTVYRLCARQDGLRPYKVGNRLRFAAEDVDAYLERCRVQPPQARGRTENTRFQYKPGMRVVNL